MDWIRYSIETTEEAEEIVSYLLSEAGIDTIEIEDLMPVEDYLQGDNYEELQPDRPEDDGKSYIHFYLPLEEDRENLMEELRPRLEEARAYANMGSLAMRREVSHSSDWQDNWKKYFHSFSIDKLLFVPSWEEPPADLQGKELIRIDPGLAFGTGKHESTALCIEAMRPYLKEKDSVLDVGFGSGILSLVAAKLGAGSLAGTDIDPICTEALALNMQMNQVEYDPSRFYIGNLIEDANLASSLGENCYDLVFSNILADIIIEMLPVLKGRMKPGGILITSGIIDFKEEEIKAALAAEGMQILEVNAMGEWRSVIARKSEEA